MGKILFLILIKGGRVDFKLDIKNGIIKNCCIEGDFFANKDISTLERALLNCKYMKDDINNVLEKIKVENYFHKITKDNLLECLID